MRVVWQGGRWRRRAARLCVWLAVAGFALAAARPLIATQATRRDGIVELVIDVSGSTNATDVTPTRLVAMKQSAMRLLDQLPPRVRVGLVSFSGSATALARPTTDRDLIRGKLGSLSAEGPTAIGDALRLALSEIRSGGPASGGPAVPAVLVLLSDGANTQGNDPLQAARAAAAGHVPVLAVAVGTLNGTVDILDEQTGQLRRIPIPPDPAQLIRIAGPTGGRALAARSQAELDVALHDLASQAGLVGGRQQEMSLLFAAAALLLLAIAGVLVPARPQPLRGGMAGLATAARRWAPPAVLLVAAAGTMAAWGHWVAPGAAAKPLSASGAIVSRLPAAPTTTLPPPFVSIDATGPEHALVERAVELLRRHGELADQRRAEISRGDLNPIEGLSLSACDTCRVGPLSGGQPDSITGRLQCSVGLNTGFIRRQARSWGVPLTELVAMAVLHEQELCLQTEHSSMVPADAEERFARKLRNGRLFDRILVQLDASGNDRATVEQALAIVRAHGELALQRRQEILQRHLNLVDPLRISTCRPCRVDLFGASTPTDQYGGSIECEVLLDMSAIEASARDWGLRVSELTASALVHLQEHCVRFPDDRETLALDQERRLARKLGSARLVALIDTVARELDGTGHWKR